MDIWQVLPAAFALLLILEGLMPFLSPARWREMLSVAQQMSDRSIRLVGLGSMLVGLLLLNWVN